MLIQLSLQRPGRRHSSSDLHRPVNIRTRQANILSNCLPDNLSDRAACSRSPTPDWRCIDAQGPICRSCPRRDTVQQCATRSLTGPNKSCRPAHQSTKAACTVPRTCPGYLPKSRTGAPDHIECTMRTPNLGANASLCIGVLGLCHTAEAETARCGSRRADVYNV